MVALPFTPICSNTSNCIQSEVTAKATEVIMVRTHPVNVYFNLTWDALKRNLTSNAHKSIRGLIIDNHTIAFVESGKAIHQDLIDHYGNERSTLNHCFTIHHDTRDDIYSIAVNNDEILEHRVLRDYLKNGLKVMLYDMGFAVDYSSYKKITASVGKSHNSGAKAGGKSHSHTYSNPPHVEARKKEIATRMAFLHSIKSASSDEERIEIQEELDKLAEELRGLNAKTTAKSATLSRISCYLTLNSRS